ncbi:MAG: preprotein translocase subunit SecA [Flavobacteriales bacterium]|jgi:preprotein translocase subunit SecA|nr:preprotein translocase subunit SecA [Flavobacteriales bacterium]
MGLLDNVLSKFFGSKADRDIKAIQPIVKQINAEYEKLHNLSHDDLRAKTLTFKEALNLAVADFEKEIKDLNIQAEKEESIEKKEALYNQIDELKTQSYEASEKVLEKILPEAFAVVKETARRFAENESIEVTATEMDKDLAMDNGHITIDGEKAVWNTTWEAGGNEIKWNMVHFDVQLIGGNVLTSGKVAEMQTGEGKTLVSTLPVYLNALTGNGVHLVTVNNYLATRDRDWMGPLYEFHGLTVDCIDIHQPNSPERKEAYLADITYGTNNEFGFDYLRDNMAQNPEDLVQRKHNYAIIDEVDSVLIDDARTPLIISGPVPQSSSSHEVYDSLKVFVEKLVQAQKKLITKELSSAKSLISSGDSKEGGKKLLRSFRGLPRNKAMIKYLSEDGVKTLLQKTENYYMQDQNKEMHIIDDDLYFTIEEKNNQIELTDKGFSLLSQHVADEHFFILPDIATEIDKFQGREDEGAIAEKDALLRDYSIKSERIHAMNQLLRAYTLFEKEVEYVVMDNKVKIVDEQTGRIMEGRRYSDGLHQAIEAKEAVNIEASTQTFATVTLQNYFRMYNKLSGMTGTAETEAKELWDIYELDVVIIPTNRPILRKDHQDKVYKTNREKFNAVVEEIEELTKAGRPVLVGTTSVEISELLSRFLKMKGIDHDVLNAKQHAREAEIVAKAGHRSAVTIATNMAGRGTDIKLSDEVKTNGGLAIIGTERHDSRRVDRQLRGRSGRQGDPGSSQFFVSLEDKLMRLFGSERIAKMMDRMNMQEGEVIQHSMITRSIENAQKKVEENNFGVRKRLLEYDDAINSQREVVYKRRRHALFGERLQVDIANTFEDMTSLIVNSFKPMNDFDGFSIEMIRVFAMNSPFSKEDFENTKAPELSQKLYDAVITHYHEKADRVRNNVFPVVKQVYEDQSNSFENMMIPFTDGQKAIQIRSNLETAFQSEGKTLITDLEKGISLAIIDEAWKEHLREMDSLKQSVQNAVYEQKDPLLIYKMESFNLFTAMLENVSRDMISFLSKAEIPMQEAPQEQVELQQVEINNASANQQQVTTAQEKKQDNNTGNQGGWVTNTSEPSMNQNNPDPRMLSTNRDEAGENKKPAKSMKVGRNEPCPCGSGKKYKQCHGKN